MKYKVRTRGEIIEAIRNPSRIVRYGDSEVKRARGGFIIISGSYIDYIDWDKVKLSNFRIYKEI